VAVRTSDIIIWNVSKVREIYKLRLVGLNTYLNSNTVKIGNNINLNIFHCIAIKYYPW